MPSSTLTKREERALELITERGWLNSISTMADGWFVAHSVPGGESRDAKRVDNATARWLIETGHVVEAGRQRSLDGQSLVVWYSPAETRDAWQAQ